MKQLIVFEAEKSKKLNFKHACERHESNMTQILNRFINSCIEDENVITFYTGVQKTVEPSTNKA